MKLSNLGSGETRLETIISYLLITGVIISLILEVIGIILYYRTYGSFRLLVLDNVMFVQGRNFFAFLYDIFRRSEIQNYSIFFMTMGMATLILTPYLMIITSFFYFLWRRRFRYVLITGILVVVISISLTLH